MPSISNGEASEMDSDLIQDILQGRPKNASQSSSSKKVKHAAILHEFMVMLSVCHTVIPEKLDDGSIIYHAASPGKMSFLQIVKLQYTRLSNFTV